MKITATVLLLIAASINCLIGNCINLILTGFSLVNPLPSHSDRALAGWQQSALSFTPGFSPVAAVSPLIHTGLQPGDQVGANF